MDRSVGRNSLGVDRSLFRFRCGVDRSLAREWIGAGFEWIGVMFVECVELGSLLGHFQDRSLAASSRERIGVWVGAVKA